MDVTIGIYYEDPLGEIAYSYMWGDNHVSLYYEDGSTIRLDENEILKWKERKDLKDFPNSKDPVLPYVFDLFFDLKRISDLKEFIHERGETDDIKELMLENNIKVLK